MGGERQATNERTGGKTEAARIGDRGRNKGVSVKNEDEKTQYHSRVDGSLEDCARASLRSNLIRKRAHTSISTTYVRRRVPNISLWPYGLTIVL